MAQVIVTESYLENIGDAIRAKLGGTDTYTPAEMAGAIAQIHGEPVLESLSVTENGTYDPSSGKDGFSQAIVNVPNTYTAGDEGKVVSNGALVAQTSDTVTANDTYDTTLINQLTVNVSGGGGGGGSQIIKDTSNPSSNVGSNNDLYLKYHNGYPETIYTRAIKDLAMTSDDYTDSNGYRFIASASSIYASAQNPWRAFNGTNTGSTDCWHPTSGTPQWIQLQFPQKIVITGFTIYNRPSNVEHPTAFTVQGSDDGTNWTDLVQVSWTESGSGIHKDVTVPPSENGYYYYRLYITGVTSSPYGVIGEIEFTELHEPNSQATSQIADEAFVKVSGTWMDVIGADISNVTSGGGGGIPIIPKEDWRAMTTAEKQECGLVIIQEATTGFQRGLYVNGADYVPFEVIAIGGAKSGTSLGYTFEESGTYQVIMLTFNTMNSTAQLVNTLTMSGESQTPIIEYYNTAHSTNDNLRNYRISCYELEASSGDSFTLSTSQVTSYTEVMYIVLDTELSLEHMTVSKSTEDAPLTYTGTHSGFVIYGSCYGNGAGDYNLNAEIIDGTETFTIQNLASSFCSAFLFVLEDEDE